MSNFNIQAMLTRHEWVYACKKHKNTFCVGDVKVNESLF